MIMHRPETNIEPWDEQFQAIKRGGQETTWRKKELLAYWKGNPDVGSPVRKELLNCNDSKTYRAQILKQVELKLQCLLLSDLIVQVIFLKSGPDIWLAFTL